MTEGKFLSLWTKYLPAIRILLKRSINNEQQISLGKMELKSVDSRKNANYSFSLEVTNGKMQNKIPAEAIGKDLFTILSGDSGVSDFMSNKNITMSMGSSSLLKIESAVI